MFGAPDCCGTRRGVGASQFDVIISRFTSWWEALAAQEAESALNLSAAFLDVVFVSRRDDIVPDVGDIEIVVPVSVAAVDHGGRALLNDQCVEAVVLGLRAASRWMRGLVLAAHPSRRRARQGAAPHQDEGEL